MSYKAMLWAAEHELPAMQKIVLMIMANLTQIGTCVCQSPHDQLAKECGMSKRSLIDQIKNLESCGLINVIKSSSEKGVNKYRLNFHVDCEK